MFYTPPDPYQPINTNSRSLAFQQLVETIEADIRRMVEDAGDIFKVDFAAQDLLCQLTQTLGKHKPLVWQFTDRHVELFAAGSDALKNILPTIRDAVQDAALDICGDIEEAEERDCTILDEEREQNWLLITLREFLTQRSPSIWQMQAAYADAHLTFQEAVADVA